jgi:hypothetical protein
MKRNHILSCCLPVLLTLPAAAMAATAAAAQSGAATAAQPAKREIIPGSELMTSQERERYRQRIRAATTPQEEEKVRAEHVKQMQERARVRGLQLADPAAQRGESK